MLVVGLVSTFLKYQPLASFKAAFSLFQVGEFSLLLSTVGVANNILPQEMYQYFLAVSIISMAITPFIMMKSDNLASFFIQIPIPKSIGWSWVEVKLKLDVNH
jgi:CPA2 family monovalent cation:H+ antiporter-2